MRAFWAPGFLKELRWIPETRLIRDLAWHVDSYDMRDATPSIFHQMCSASTAMSLQTLTMVVSSGNPRTREDLVSLFGQIVNACNESLAHTLSDRLLFKFDLKCYIGGLKLECELERLKGLSKGISEDELKRLCDPHPPRNNAAPRNMIYFIG